MAARPASLAQPPCVDDLPRTELATLHARVDALHRALLARDACAQCAAHDLRTPINTLSGLLHLMQMKFAAELPEKAAEYLKVMAQAVLQMEQLSTAIQDSASTAYDNTQVDSVDLRDALDQALHGLDHDPAALSISGTSWPVDADPVQLHILLTNVLRNAIQHPHPARPLRLVIRFEPALNGTGTLSICDNGTGFAPTEGHAIFLPYRKGEGGDRGAGVGLATCRAICAQHGWGIQAQSDGTSGACFEIVFNTS